MPRLLTGLEPDSEENRRAIRRGERDKIAVEEGRRANDIDAARADFLKVVALKVLRRSAADMGRVTKRAMTLPGDVVEKRAYEYAKAAASFARGYVERGGTVEDARDDEFWSRL